MDIIPEGLVLIVVDFVITGTWAVVDCWVSAELVLGQ